MAESQISGGVQGDLEKELTCSVSQCSFFEVGVATEGGGDAEGRNVTTMGWKEGCRGKESSDAFETRSLFSR